MTTVDYRLFINRNLPIRERACESKAVYLSRGEARSRVRKAAPGTPGCTLIGANIARTGTLAIAADAADASATADSANLPLSDRNAHALGEPSGGGVLGADWQPILEPLS